MQSYSQNNKETWTIIIYLNGNIFPTISSQKFQEIKGFTNNNHINIIAELNRTNSTLRYEKNMFRQGT